MIDDAALGNDNKGGGRMAHWRDSTRPFDDWLPMICERMEIQTAGRLNRRNLYPRPVAEILRLADGLAEQEIRTFEAMIGASLRRSL